MGVFWTSGVNEPISELTGVGVVSASSPLNCVGVGSTDGSGVGVASATGLISGVGVTSGVMVGWGIIDGSTDDGVGEFSGVGSAGLESTAIEG